MGPTYQSSPSPHPTLQGQRRRWPRANALHWRCQTNSWLASPPPPPSSTMFRRQRVVAHALHIDIVGYALQACEQPHHPHLRPLTPCRRPQVATHALHINDAGDAFSPVNLATGRRHAAAGIRS
jgi:hypothetical protein